jgi:hypothetical protein
MKRLLPKLLPSLLSIVALTAVATHGRAAEKLSYNRDVRPILSDTCFKCHGPDKGNRKGKLRLDVREAALAKEAFVPGKPAESELVKRLHATDPDDVMPPKESARQLTDAQRAVLERWIAEGAVYEPHWAYIAPKKPAPPAVTDKAWSANPIDAFVRARLDTEKVMPSPEADRATLLRRLSLDLTGLPPTPAEIATFLADKSADAYEQQVQRLLASPHYGERMAVPWLDAVRFADTVGFHGDQNLNNFPYRDWVIGAFNRDLPFDRFTAEQLAGDLLPDADDSTRTASGFNRLNMMTREGGAQPKEYLAKYTADRVRTLGGAWLGSTLACCECHDHKYDPWGIKDFYQFASFFADVKQWGVYADYGYTKNPDLAGFNNDYPFPPEIAVESPYLKLRTVALRDERAQVIAKAAAGADAKARAAWRDELGKFLTANPDGWEKLAPPALAEDAKAGYTVAADGVVNVTAKKDENVVLRLTPADGTVACVRLDLVLGDKGGVLLSGKGGGDVALKVAYRPSGAQKGGNLGVRRSDATAKKPKYLSGAEVIGLQRGWAFTAEQAATATNAVWVLDKPVTIKPGDVLEITLEKNDLAHLRLSVSPLVPSDLTKPDFSKELLKRLRKADRDPAVDDAWLMATATDATAYGRVTQLEREIDECRGGRAMTVVSEAWNPLTVRVLPRGNWQDENGEVVSPAAPHFLTQITAEKDRRLTRLDLATWLTSADNPLTARVYVNRLWAQFMGVGLCATVDDLGLQGEWPSHPELLDWLAVEFREKGWDVKKLVTLIVTSKTYRQSSVLLPEVLAKDPANRLRASQSPRRLDAEFVRDNALSISGLLNGDLGGPSVKPYQPPGYYANLQFPDRDYTANNDDRQYRRGVYMHWQRTFLHPMLANFDAPSRDECAVFRTQANSPQQALTLLNDPTFVEAARTWAARLISSGGDDAAKLAHAFTTALGRAPSAEESGPLLKFLAKQRAAYAMQADAASALLRTGLAPLPPEDQRVEIAAWTQVCRVILNLHETITRL